MTHTHMGLYHHLILTVLIFNTHLSTTTTTPKNLLIGFLLRSKQRGASRARGHRRPARGSRRTCGQPPAAWGAELKAGMGRPARYVKSRMEISNVYFFVNCQPAVILTLPCSGCAACAVYMLQKSSEVCMFAVPHSSSSCFQAVLFLRCQRGQHQGPYTFTCCLRGTP